MKPAAQREGLVIEEVGGELVVYDRRRHRAHHLNRAAALVWERCDGRHTVADLAKLLRNKLGGAASEETVSQALEQLGKADLLQERLKSPRRAAGLTRREALRTMGKAAAVVMVPLVTSVVAPMPLQADPPIHCNQAPCLTACANQCTTDVDCPGGKVCRTLRCRSSSCQGCRQRRCIKGNSPSKKG